MELGWAWLLDKRHVRGGMDTKELDKKGLEELNVFTIVPLGDI